MTKVKKFFRPRTVAVFAIAMIFALSGLFGALAAPISRIINADGGLTGSYNTVTKYNINGLPMKSLAKGTVIRTAGVPSAGSGDVVKLYRKTSVNLNNGLVAIGTSTEFATGQEKADSQYASVGEYQWLFYSSSADAIANTVDNAYYSYKISVYQDSFSFELQTSATYAHDGGAISWIPNVVNVGRHVLLAMPSTFNDKNGVDLFDNKNQDRFKLRKKFNTEWETAVKRPSATDISGTSVADPDYTSTPTSDYWTRDNTFQKLVWANIQLSFSNQDTTNLYAINHSSDSYGAYIYAHANAKAVRTMVPQSTGIVSATYTLKNSNIKASRSTADINVNYYDRAEKTPFDPSKNAMDNEIVFKETPVWFDSVWNTTSISYNNPDDKKFPLPRVRVGTVTDARKEPAFETSVSLGQDTITSYTYINVYYYATTESAPVFKQRIDEKDDYIFRPTEQGLYAFKYFTTTLFGTGYADFNANDNDAPRTVETDGVNYLSYYPNSVLIVNASSSQPKFKWSLPFDYKNETINGATKRVAVIDDNLVSGDAIVGNTKNELFSTVEREFKQGDKIEDPTDDNFFKNAPDLLAYLPSAGRSPVTQVRNDQTLTLPALLGYNAISNGVNNASGETLAYKITITRTSDDKYIQFDSEHKDTDGTPKASTIHTKYYDHTKPLEIKFGTLAEYNPGATLEEFKNDKNGTYVIDIDVNDKNDQKILFDSEYLYQRAQSNAVYSFSLVDPADFKMNRADPRVTDISLDQKIYYSGHTISFREPILGDDYTSNVNVEYYLVYGAGSIKLEKANVAAGTVSVNLNEGDDIGKQLLALFESADGEVPVKIIAVARNYFALQNQINKTTWDKDSAYVDFGAMNLGTLNTYLAATPETGTFDGVNVKAFEIRLLDLSYGAQAVIGILNRGTTVDADLNKTDGTDLTTEWSAKYTTSGDSNVKANGGARDLPLFTVKYDTRDGVLAARRFDTIVKINVLTPNKKPLNLTGGNSHGLTLTEGATYRGGSYKSGREYEVIPQLKFTPTQIGSYTFIVTVDSGNFISILKGTIYAVGTPVTTVVAKGGKESVQVGEPCPIPWVEVSINGNKFKTDDNESIYADYKPAEVVFDKDAWEWDSTNSVWKVNESATGTPDPVTISWDSATKTPSYTASTDENGTGFLNDENVRREFLTVGNYIWSCVGKNGAEFNAQNGFLIFADISTYTFYYTLNFDKDALGRIGIAAETDFSPEQAATFSVTTTPLVKGDIIYGADEDSYNSILNQTFKNIYDDKVTGTVTKNNLIPNIKSTADIVIDKKMLDDGLTLSSVSESIFDDDLYDFGAIFLPNLATGLKPSGKNLYLSEIGLDLSKSVVKVEHDIRPNEPIFTSEKIGADTDPETKLAEITSGDVSGNIHYYFRPEGKVKVSKPKDVVLATEDFNAGLIAAVPTHEGSDTAIVTLIGGGSVTYTWVGTADGYWRRSNRVYLAEGNTWTMSDSSTLSYNASEEHTNNDKYAKSIIVDGREINVYWEHSGDGAGVGQWFYLNYNCPFYKNSIAYTDARDLETGSQVRTPDGAYTVSYSYTFGGTTENLSYKIYVGDNKNPVLTLDADVRKNVFGSDKKYEVGDIITLKTGWFKANASAGKMTPQDDDGNFVDWWVGKKLDVRVARPNSAGTLTTASSPDTTGDNYVTPNLTVDQIFGWKRAANGKRSDRFGYEIEENTAGADHTPEGEYRHVPDNSNIKGYNAAGDKINRERTFTFKVTETGTYTVEFWVYSATTKSSNIVTEYINVPASAARSSVSPQTIWGIVLIILSSGLLLGVVVYFIQTGRSTKFLTANTVAKGSAKVSKKDKGTFKEVEKVEASAPTAIETPEEPKE